MFDTMHERVVAFRRKKAKPTQPPPEADALKARCLHPAEAWALRRRAHRPQPAPRRLPAVARG